jgi:hypothetical protein
LWSLLSDRSCGRERKRASRIRINSPVPEEVCDKLLASEGRFRVDRLRCVTTTARSSRGEGSTNSALLLSVSPALLIPSIPSCGNHQLQADRQTTLTDRSIQVPDRLTKNGKHPLLVCALKEWISFRARPARNPIFRYFGISLIGDTQIP